MGACDTRGQGPPTQWLSLPFYAPEGAWRLSWQFPGPTGSSQKGTPRGLRTLTELFALPSFSALALPVILLRLRHFLPVIRPWWSVFAPFTSLAAAASAKDKAEAAKVIVVLPSPVLGNSVPRQKKARYSHAAPARAAIGYDRTVIMATVHW